MGKKIQDIQAIIDKRANDKLDADLLALYAVMSSQKLLRNMNDGGSLPSIYFQTRPLAPFAFPAEPAVYKEFHGYDIFSAYQNRPGDPVRLSAYMEKLRAYWLTEYIQRETLDFFQRVDRLTGDVAELLDAKQARDAY